MKKLLIATDAFLPRWDGIARFLSEVIPRLARHYNITVVAPAFRGRRARIKGAHIVRIPLHEITVGDYTPSIIDLRRIKKLVGDNDIVFTQSIGPIGAPAIYYAHSQKKRCVAFMHSIDWELVSKSIKNYRKTAYAVVKKIARYLYNKCSVVIVPSKEIRKILEREGITTATRIVHVGTDSEAFSPGNRKKAKRMLGLGKKFVIGFVGRIGREKDLATLEKAYFAVKKRHPGTELIIVGKGVREEMSRLRKGKIRVVGSKDNVLPYYHAMNVFVLPSLTETSSIATMEAMSCGLPVIVTPVGFLKNYIKEGKNGMFFPCGNAERLARKIEMIMNDRKLRERMGRNARKTIMKRFMWEKTVEKIRKVL